MSGEGRDLALVDAVGTRLGDSQICAVDSSLAFPLQNRDPGSECLQRDGIGVALARD